VCRAIAIATEKPYQEVYDAINNIAVGERRGKRKRGVSSARTGVYKDTTRQYLASLGWKWVPTMQIGQGCKVHLTDGELPNGRLIVKVSKHLTAVIDGVINDTYDPQRATFIDGQERLRCVYGYWHKDGMSQFLEKLSEKMKSGTGYSVNVEVIPLQGSGYGKAQTT
jgi:hypothetical protein